MTVPAGERAGHRVGPAETSGLLGRARLSQLLAPAAGLGASLSSVYLLPVWAAPGALLPVAGAALVAFLPVRGGLVLLDSLRLAAAHGLARAGGAARWRS